MIESKRITLIDKEDLVLDLEYNEQYAILHLPVMRMSRDTYTDFLDTVPQLHTFLTMVGYSAVWAGVRPEDTMIAKLLGRLGATKIGNAEGLDVYEYKGAK
jgi:hypothetical protein